MYKKIAFFLTFAVLQSLAMIDPNNYIWFNFQTKTYVQSYSTQYKEVVLPCETRIGTCLYKFTLLPPDWKAENNKLLIPSSSAYKTLNYAVEVTVSDLTGESLRFSLVLEMSAGGIITNDRGQFLGTGSAPSSSSSDTSSTPKTPSSLTDFPTLPQIQLAIQSGDPYNITNIISDVINRNPPNCQDKVAYLRNVLSLLNDKTLEYDAAIKVLATEIDTRFKQIQELEKQKAVLENEMNSENKVKVLESEIKELNAARATIYSSYNRYSIIANSYLAKIQKSAVVNTTDTESLKEIIEMEAEVEMLDQRLKELIERKKQLENQIASQKLIAVTSESALDSSMAEALEKQYRYYSELAIQEKAKYEKLDYEIRALETSLASKTGGVTSLDEKIKEVEAEIKKLDESGERQKIKDLSNLNQILKSNAISVQNKVDSLKSKCSSGF